MFSQCFPEFPLLVTNFWWIHMVENRPHQLNILLTLNNLGKFIQTPIEIVELSMVLRSWAEICSPLRRVSSMKVRIPRRTKALYKWPMKPRRVSSPLKLKKTSKFMGRGVEGGRWDFIAGHKRHGKYRNWWLGWLEKRRRRTWERKKWDLELEETIEERSCQFARKRSVWTRV